MVIKMDGITEAAIYLLDLQRQKKRKEKFDKRKEKK